MVSDGGFYFTERCGQFAITINSKLRKRVILSISREMPLLLEELEVIISILIQQVTPLKNLKPLFYGKYETNVGVEILDQTNKQINERIDDLGELQKEAQGLQTRAHLLKTESNNNAILVFTMVTVVFLPLPFVASYLGMITSDIRNLAAGQTLFWAVVLPVAFTALGVALLIAFYGTLERLTGTSWDEWADRKEKVE